MSCPQPQRLALLVFLVLAAPTLGAERKPSSACLVEDVRSGATSVSMQKCVKVVLGKYELCVPKQAIHKPPFPWYLKGIEGKLPRSVSVSLIIGAQEAASHIEGFQTCDGRRSDTLYYMVELLGESEIAKLLDPEMHVYSDTWYGRGLMANRVVEAHETGLFKVRYDDSSISWIALKIYPESSRPPPERPFAWYMASCYETTSRLTATGDLTDCITKFVYDDLLFSVSFNGKNLGVVEDIRAMLADRFFSYLAYAPAE